ncbi:RNA polymerase sigma factor [Advenella kashmirensis]
MRIICNNGELSTTGPFHSMPRRPSPDKGLLAHYCELVGTWARRANSVPDAEDAAHDAVVGILERNGATIVNPRAYLHRSTANGLISRYRHQKACPTSALHELPEEQHPTVDDVEAAVHLSQLSQALLEALDELPIVCQQVFAWHRIEGWTVPEIASRMGLSVSMVEKHLTKSMRHLHQKLERFSS